MKNQPQMNAGPGIDVLIAKKLMNGEVRAYSSDPDCTYLVLNELARHGLEVEYDDSDGVTCTIKKDSRPIASKWGVTFEEAICRASLAVLESEPA